MRVLLGGTLNHCFPLVKSSAKPSGLRSHSFLQQRYRSTAGSRTWEERRALCTGDCSGQEEEMEILLFPPVHHEGREAGK